MVSFRLVSPTLPGERLADVHGAVLEADSRGFASPEKRHRLAVHEPHLLQIERNRVMSAHSFVDQPPKLRDVLQLDSTTQHQADDVAFVRSLYLQNHRGSPM